MKVIFNEFPLGSEIYDPRYKTGIYRVVEQLASNLALAAAVPRNQLEVDFHTTGFLWAAYCYFEKHLRGHGTKFVTHSFPLALARAANEINQFCIHTHSNRRLALRAFRWAITRGFSVGHTPGNYLRDQTLAEADIYHSPFVAIPKEVRRSRKLRRFTTVYDLIPITHPEFFDQGPIDILRGVVKSLEPEDFVTCISHSTKEQLLQLVPRLDPQRVFVTHLAAGSWCRREENSSHAEKVLTAFGLGPDTPYFLSLCTLEPRKNLEAVIRAFGRLRAEGQIGTEHRLVLVGSRGWKTGKILDALKEADHCRDAIVLTGFVPDEDLPSLYAGALAFVYVSRLEGFGLPPLEAMQCGAPVITSNTSSLPEVVGDAGLTVDPDDLDELCSHMLRLSRNEGMRRELSARSLARARIFSWERFGQETLAAYRAATTMG